MGKDVIEACTLFLKQGEKRFLFIFRPCFLLPPRPVRNPVSYINAPCAPEHEEGLSFDGVRLASSQVKDVAAHFQHSGTEHLHLRQFLNHVVVVVVPHYGKNREGLLLVPFEQVGIDLVQRGNAVLVHRTVVPWKAEVTEHDEVRDVLVVSSLRLAAIPYVLRGNIGCVNIVVGVSGYVNHLIILFPLLFVPFLHLLDGFLKHIQL